MSAQDENHFHDPALQVAKALNTYWAWFGRLIVGWPTVGDVRIHSVSLRWRGTDWFCVVGGLDLVTVKNVVAFGAGARGYEALRNVTTAIRKREWKPDKYRPTV